MRGTTYTGFIAGWDWYATFCDLAGVDPTDSRARLADLPPIDSHSLVPILLGKTSVSPRKELAIGMPTMGGPERGGGYVGGLIQYPWKLLVGDVPMAGWTGPKYPNHTTDTNCFTSVSANPSKIPLPCAPECLCIAHCGVTGCLYNIEEDMTEHNDVAASNQAIARRMLARIAQVSDRIYPRRIRNVAIVAVIIVVGTCRIVRLTGLLLCGMVCLPCASRLFFGTLRITWRSTTGKAE